MKNRFVMLSQKPIKIILVVSTILVLCATGVIMHEQKTKRAIKNTVIIFQDKNLEQVIRTNINKPTGDILKGDVDSIRELSVRKKNISNISGVENFTNLIHLDLSYNQVNDIEPLKGMTNLSDLHLDSNQISNIEPLRALINLLGLELGANPIKDYAPVSSYYKNLQDKDFTLD